MVRRYVEMSIALEAGHDPIVGGSVPIEGGDDEDRSRRRLQGSDQRLERGDDPHVDQSTIATILRAFIDRLPCLRGVILLWASGDRGEGQPGQWFDSLVGYNLPASGRAPSSLVGREEPSRNAWVTSRERVGG